MFTRQRERGVDFAEIDPANPSGKYSGRRGRKPQESQPPDGIA
jgi:hypothetical protein